MRAEQGLELHIGPGCNRLRTDAAAYLLLGVEERCTHLGCATMISEKEIPHTKTRFLNCMLRNQTALLWSLHLLLLAPPPCSPQSHSLNPYHHHLHPYRFSSSIFYPSQPSTPNFPSPNSPSDPTRTAQLVKMQAPIEVDTDWVTISIDRTLSKHKEWRSLMIQLVPSQHESQQSDSYDSAFESGECVARHSIISSVFAACSFC